MSPRFRSSLFGGLVAATIALGGHVAAARVAPFLSQSAASAIRGGDCSLCQCTYSSSGRCNADDGCSNGPCTGDCSEACTKGGVWNDGFTEQESANYRESTIACGNSLTNPTCETVSVSPTVCKCTGGDSGNAGQFCGDWPTAVLCE